MTITTNRSTASHLFQWGLYALLALCTALFNPALAAAGNRLDPDNLQLGSVSAMVFDLKSGESLYEKYPGVKLPIASLTKMMTALVVLESREPLNAYLEIHRDLIDVDKNAYSRLRNASRLKRKDLLRIALMSSENLATYVLASHHPGGLEAFLQAMNQKARELGMVSTTFDDPSGLSPHNISTASDLTKLLKAAYKHELIREYSTTGQFTARFKSPRYVLGYGNTNRLVHRSQWGVELSKTGYLSEAGRCLLLVTRIDGRLVGMVLLNSFGKQTHIGDAGRVKRWLTTGNGGKLARSAQRYQAERLEELLAATPDKPSSNRAAN